MAYESEADVVGYGGAAGGGKTDLACGKALTQHRKVMVLRRVGTELTGIEDRLEELIGDKKGYNGQKKIWKHRKPDGAKLQIEFASLPNAGDEKGYQGRPHDLLCVGADTPVRMADGSSRAVQYVQVGDMVSTLEGPRRVNRVWPVRRDHAVRLTAGGYTQVQSTTHRMLTDEGWVSCDTLRSACFCGSAEAMPRPHDGISARLSSHLSTALRLSPRALRSLCTPQLEPLLFSRRLSSQGFGAFGGLSVPGTDCVGSWYRHSAFEPRLSETGLPELLRSCRRLWARAVAPSSATYGAPGERSSSSPQGSMGRCSAGSHPCGGRIPLGEDFCSGLEGDRLWLHQSSDAAQPNPICSPFDCEGQTPRHICRRASYAHPYTREIRPVAGRVTCSSFSLEPVGVVDLYDLEIEGANHYISGPGIVNKNCFDEAANFQEAQVRFLMGWVRTTMPGQRCQTLMCFNPPTTAEGRWIVDYFAPWLDPKHPDPAMPGELRYFAMLDAREVECVNGEPFDWTDKDGKVDRIVPKSRTFIPSKVTDNPYLMNTGYRAMLQALPEPLRSMMLNGDFMAGVTDDPWQVIPTAWVEAAQARWAERKAEFKGVTPKMNSMGVDVARGGQDETVIARRHDNWYDELLVYPGSQTPNGQAIAATVLTNLRDSAPIHIDVIGVGSSPYDMLVGLKQQVIGVNVAEKANGTDQSGRLRFKNQRSELWWMLREALDPINNTGIALPPDRKLLGDLCAPKWELQGFTIYVEGREDIVKRIGRSVDRASAVILAQLDTPCLADLHGARNRQARGDYDPYARTPR